MTLHVIRSRLPLLLLVVACRPQQSDIDEINRKLDDLAAAQAQLVANLDNAWAREREYEPELERAAEQGRADTTAAEASAREFELEEEKRYLERRIERLEAAREMPSARPAAPAVAKPRPGRPDPKQRYRVLVGSSHVRGPRNARVTVVMWTSYQCPFSKRVQPTLAALRAKYPKKVRFVHKNNPLPMHNRAMPAAIAAEAAARQGKFWEMHDRLWADHRALTEENFEKFAAELHLDLRKFDRDRDDPALRKRIKAEQAQGTELGARGTPAFFINGRFLSGAQPQEAFERLIEEELKVADKMIGKGVPRRRVYKELMKKALPKP